MGLIRQIEMLLVSRTVSRSGRESGDGASDPFLQEVWCSLRREFFPDRSELDSYLITWSSRAQKRVLASCNIRRRRVVVARELFEPAAVRWIGPVLYHELCHAVIDEGVARSRSGKRMWHGAEFRELERRHPDIEALHAWIASGGWAMAVRSNRTRRFWRERRAGAPRQAGTVSAVSR